LAEKVLYLLNVSNPDRLTADSGWLFADILVPALADQGTAVTVSCPVPLSDPRIGHVPLPAPSSKYRARFSVDVAAIAQLISDVAPSVVVVNQIEHATAVRAALLESGRRARLAGYCHYLPFHVDECGVNLDASLKDAGLGRSVLMQFLSGLLALDRILVHSLTASSWLERVATRVGAELTGRVRIVPPPRDPRLIGAPGEHAPPKTGETVTVIYNHRLYEHYGTGRFLELAAQLTANPAMRLLVLDLFGAQRARRAPLDESPQRYRAALEAMPGVRIATDGGDRARYRRLLASAHLALAPFRPGCTWSMSLIDCQAMGVPAVEESLGFDQAGEAVKLAETLTSDPAAWSAASRRAEAGTRALAPELIAPRYLAAIV
jgi:hypothetical protein